MDDSLIISLLAVFSIQFVLTLIIGLVYSFSKNRSTGKVSALSVIIPFKNESQRIKTLLSSLDGLDDSMINVEYIFVNDHSTGNEETQIKELKKPFVLLHNTGKGKKEAIRTGVLKARHSYILTWDADIGVPPNYFKHISTLEPIDMWILPVRMTGSNLISRLGCIDQSWTQMIGYVFRPIGKPFVASGANLLFDKSKFLEVDTERSDYQIASGDDMFLLREFNKREYEIAVSNDRELQVTTNSPDSFNSLISQRSRWAKKMKHIRSYPAFYSGALLITLNIIFLLTLLLFGLTLNEMYLIPIAIKISSEYLILRLYKGLESAGVDLVVVLIHQIFFPIYLMAILFSKGKEERWA